MWPFSTGAVRYVAILAVAVAVAGLVAKTAAESAVDAKLQVQERFAEPTKPTEEVRETFVTEINAVIARLRALSDVLQKPAAAAAAAKEEPKPKADDADEDMEHFVSGVQEASSLHANAFPYRRI